MTLPAAAAAGRVNSKTAEGLRRSAEEKKKAAAAEKMKILSKRFVGSRRAKSVWPRLLSSLPSARSPDSSSAAAAAAVETKWRPIGSAVANGATDSRLSLIHI